MRAPFQNEPSLDFSLPENRAAMQQALNEVEAELGRRYPLIINGERRETGEWITSTNPGNPGQVVGEVAKARPQVLEPIVNLDVTVPNAHMGDVTGGLAGKRARINGTDSLRGGEIVVKAQVPLAEIVDYQTELKAMTGGEGRYTIEFSHYEPVPPQVQKQLVESYKPRPEED